MNFLSSAVLSSLKRSHMMMRHCIAFSLLLVGAQGIAERPAAPGANVNSFPNNSLKHEIKNAIDKGISWLEKNQQSGGYWSTADHPSITALALTAIKGGPENEKAESEFTKNGYAFLISNV